MFVYLFMLNCLQIWPQLSIVKNVSFLHYSVIYMFLRVIYF